jgi:hypothetical protein
MNAADDRFVIDWNSVDLYSFVKLDQMRRGKESSLDSRRPGYRLKHSANGPLAVRTRDMNELQRVLRFSQGRQQAANVVQTELDSPLLSPE